MNRDNRKRVCHGPTCQSPLEVPSPMTDTQGSVYPSLNPVRLATDTNRQQAGCVWLPLSQRPLRVSAMFDSNF